MRSHLQIPGTVFVELAFILTFVLALGLPFRVPATEIAARPDGLEEKDPVSDEDNGFRKAGQAVLEVQKALSEMGFYLGSIDGHLNPETRAAIRVYQQGAGLKVDGKVTRRLWNLLMNSAEVHNLLKRLERVRKSDRDKARQALLAHPATRDLIKDTSGEKADPTRDATACFADPTVRCLLDAALENVKAVFKPELRDWALGEILVAQSRAGLNQAAMETAARMKDPRLIMVALRDIAEGQATSGNAAGARDAAGIIPDITKRAEAFAAIAEIQTRRHDFDDARLSIDLLSASLDQLESEPKRISLETRIAVMLAKAGDSAGAADRLAKAEVRARTRTTGEEKGIALRYVAAALAETEHPDQALNVLNDIEASSERTSVLISTATAQARAGDAAAALATADTIEAVRYRAVVLGKIALSQANTKNFSAADTTLETALAAVDKITLPYARSYAISRIALSMSKLGTLIPADTETPSSTKDQTKWSRFAKAAGIAEGIDDNRLRAHTLWAISADQRRGGDVEGAESTEQLASKASDDIKSRLTRVWMFAELAGNHARAGEPQISWKAFRRGLDIASKIENSWGRSRALAKLAQTLIDMVVPGTAHR